jgi:hypothetical protein
MVKLPKEGSGTLQGEPMQATNVVSRMLPVSLLITAMSVAPPATSPAQARLTEAIPNRAPLRQNAFNPLPLGSVKPAGWLRRQLEIQANGLTGHLDEFWPDLGPNSGWLGGTGESWERGPYYLDGLVPLAYLLDDPTLIAKSSKRVNWILTHQGDGWLGPQRNRDWWPNMVVLKALTQYQEATGDARVIPAMQRYFQYQAAHLQERPLKDWGKFRWADEVVSVLWLYNRTGDASLLDLARTLEVQGHDWKGEFAAFPFTSKTDQDRLGFKDPANNEVSLSAHGVNNAMALKASGVWWLVSGNSDDRDATDRQLAELDHYHLLPNGMFSCDEHLAGHDPSQGSELCSVVETQFSLEQLVSIFGEARLGDRLERVAFNALPATFSKDMWAHQYDQQPNQVLCSLAARDWTTNGPDSNIYGLEPNFGCCTANMHQGWPKFAASLWMATPDGGLAAVAYAPSEVSTEVRGGTPVRITEDTRYPFSGDARLVVDPAVPTQFPIRLRIPAWAAGARIAVNGATRGGKLSLELPAGGFQTVERRWKRGDRIDVHFPLKVRTSQWYHDSITVERGPLIFSLKIGEEWQKLDHGMPHPAKPPAADWEVLPTTPWNYGLILDRDHPENSVRVMERPMGQFPFSDEGTPIELVVKGKQIPDWKLVDSSAGPVPASPVVSHEPVKSFTLIPYGAAKLRITAFPLIAAEGKGSSAASASLH